MSRNQVSRRRIPAALVALAAAAATVAALAAPAGAAVGQGAAVVALAQHDKGRTLSGQGVKVLTEAPASQDANKLTLPVSEVDPGANPSTNANGSLRFKKGKRSVTVTSLRFDLTAGTLNGKVGTSDVAVFQLGAAPAINGTAGTVVLNDGKLRLTEAAAELLQEKLGLQRALVHKGVGMLWLNAKANPVNAAPQAVASGAANWGVLSTWRSYVLGQQGPPMSVGTISVEGGATQNGTMSEASAFFGFPATGGSYQKGLYGAADKLTLTTQGTVKFAKPFHCIVEVKLSQLEVRIDGANSALVLDSTYDIDTPAGKTCLPQPAVTLTDLTFATLELGSVAPTYSADGKTITWTNIPAALTAGGTALFGGLYPAGKALDPITITATIG
jgi:hypothetical protein